MNNNPVMSVVEEAAVAAVGMLPSLKGENRKAAIATLVQLASRTPAVMRKFAYAMDETSYTGKGKSRASPVPGDGTSRYEALPSLRLPAMTRVRQNRPRVQIDYVLPAATKEFLNASYSTDVVLEFKDIRHHDHPEAAASRKIEGEVLMMRLRAKGADFLKAPTNYEYSVIDTGGDWRYHYIRKHEGVHVDAPFLSARDYSRDARKRLQLDASAPSSNDLFVCRHKLQECTITAPFAKSIHSSYDIPPMQICESMAARGILHYEGSMHIPEELRVFDTLYVDPHYGYVIEPDESDLVSNHTYLPPQIRHGMHKYLHRDGTRKVRYRYPAGESREYVHDLSLLRSYLDPAVYLVPTAHGPVYRYEYKVYKRVGSLAYFSFSYVQDKDPAHVKLMATVAVRPFDGYLVSFDSSILQDYVVSFMRGDQMLVPRQLFVATAAYSLTQVNNPSFTIEGAIAYARSASTTTEANGIVAYSGTQDSSHGLLVVTGASAFLWAYDRYRLMELRLPSLAVADAVSEVQDSLFGDSGVLGLKQVFNNVRQAATRWATDTAADFAFTNLTSYSDLMALYDKLSASATPGLTSITDMCVVYPPLIELMSDSSEARARVSDVAVEAVAPCYPVYEYAKTISQQIREDEAVAESNSSYQGTTAVASRVDSVSRPQFVPIVEDMINLSAAQEAERDQTARQVFDQVFDLSTRAVVSMSTIRGLVKGTPTVLTYTDGQLFKITTLEKEEHRGTVAYDKLLTQLVGSRAMYPEKVGTDYKFGTGILRADGALASDRHCRTSSQSFQALIEPALRVLNSSRLLALRQRLYEQVTEVTSSGTVLHNEVAGSGKTQTQCALYKERTEAGQTVAILSSTITAAEQASERLQAWGVSVVEGSISTVDSFLMSKHRWKAYDLVLIDEALQLHAGKIYAVMMLTGAVIRGYGDRNQIGFIAFSRMYKPAVDTNFPWGEEQKNMLTYRIPNGPVVEWLQDPALYGAEFSTKSLVRGGLVLFARAPSYANLITRKTLFHAMGLLPSDKLLVLVYLSDEAMQLRGKLAATTSFELEGDFRVAVKTIGESQGDDQDNVLLLRMTSRDEPLFNQKSQTLVGITRVKRRFGYVTVHTKFPSMLEKVAGHHLVEIPSFANPDSAWIASPKWLS